MYTFSDNSVYGTSVGYGGAIYAWRDLTILGGTFLNNTASHFGGAIFISSYSIDINDTVVQITATKDYPILFEGNRQNTNMSDEFNSIYFEADEYGEGTINATFTVEEDASFLMYDPINSASTGNLTITKNGSGIWQFGGQSVLNGKDTIIIKEGTLRLLAGSSVMLTNATSSFEVSPEGEIQVVINSVPVYISANDIVLNGRMSVYLDPSYSFLEAILDGDKMILMYMNITSGNVILSNVTEIQPVFSDVIIIGDCEYMLDDNPLRFEIDPEDPAQGTLSLYLKKIN